ncbi:MAG: MSCRAMM family protein [Tsuneonella sp.]
MLLQMTLGKYVLSQDIRGYQTPGGVCVDLADVIQSLDLPIRLDKKSRRATGWLFAEDQKLTIDREANTVQNGNNDRAPIGDEIHDTPEGWCVDLAALSRWFGIGLKPDLYRAAIRIDDSVKLPFVAALERKSRAARLRPKPTFDLAQFPKAPMEYRMWRAPSVDTVVNVGFGAGHGRSQLAASVETYAAGEIAGVSYNARLATDGNLRPQSLRMTAYRNDPEARMLGPLRATQVAVGDVQTDAGQLTGRSQVGRGVYVSNNPIGRSAQFSTTSLRGALPAGWDAELYRNGQLIGFQSDTSNGRYEFIDQDLYFGRNDFEVVLYGPQGQIRRVRESVPVGTLAVEPGKTYYWAGAVQDGRDLIGLDRQNTLASAGHWRWGVGVERGLDQRTSVAAGLQSLFYSGRRRSYIEGNLSRSFGSMQVVLAAAHERGAGALVQANVLGALHDVSYAANLTWMAGDYTSEFASPDLAWRAGFRADTSLRLGKAALPLQLGIGRTATKDGRQVTEWLMGTSFTLLQTAVTAEIQRSAQGAIDDASSVIDPQTQLRLLASRRMFGLSLRGGADFNLSGEDKGFQAARLYTSVGVGRTSDLSAQVEYQAANSDTRFQLGYSRDFGKFALRSDAFYSTSGNVGIKLNIAFSFGPSADGGLRLSSTKLARSGQAEVRVFRDNDGDGRFGAGDEPLPDVYLTAGVRRTESLTGKNGMAMVDELKPFVPVLIGVDEATLNDPYLAPRSKGVVVTPRPGVHAQIDFPVSPAGEVEGEVQSKSGMPAAGVTLELVDARGAVAASAFSEFDGFFLFERVPYGRYRLRVSPGDKGKVQLADQRQAEVVVGRDADVGRMGVVKLAPATTTIAAAGS